MNAEIITIGDELLIGQVIDTNSAFIARQLNQIGIAVVQITSISDSPDAIKSTLDQATERADVIIMTGGLGPTKDDLTKKTLSDYFNLPLKEDVEVLEQLKKFIHSRGFTLTDLNRMQALVPETTIPLKNKLGTAPGMWIVYKEKIFISLPGVPYEMMQLIEDEVIPRLQANIPTNQSIHHHTIFIHGLPESMLAERISTWENELPEPLRLAYLPSPGRIRLRLSAKGNEGDKLLQSIKNEITKLYQIIPEHILYEGDIPIETALYQVMTEKGLSLAVAESCTGGSLGGMLVSQAGSSAYFKGGVIAYSNEVKMNQLQVRKKDLEDVGAVSETVACQMAEGVRLALSADVGVAITGIAGPDGGSNEKPVGTVWIGFSLKSKVSAQQFRFNLNRQQNINRAVSLAIVQLIVLLKKI